MSHIFTPLSRLLSQNACSFFSHYSDIDYNGTIYDDTAVLDEYRSFESIVVIAIPLVFGIITLLGLLGNGLVIWAILVNKKMRSTMNLLILNLAMADCLFIVICVPFTAVEYITPKYIFGRIWCKISQYFIFVCACVSVYSLVLMSLVRCIVVVRPFKARTLVTTRRVGIAVLFVWIVFLSGFSPLLGRYEIYSYKYYGEELSVCLNLETFYNPEHNKLFFWHVLCF